MPGTLFKPYNLIVPANGRITLFHFAKFLALLENDQATSVGVKIGPGGPGGEMPKGLAIELPQDKHYSSIGFSNPTGVDMAITVALSDGRIYDNRMVLPASSVFSNILGELQGDTTPENWGTEKDVDTAATTPARTVILAANVNRRACIVQAKSTNTGIIYIGFDATVAANKWIAELQASQAYSVDDYRGPLWAVASADNQLAGWGEW